MLDIISSKSTETTVPTNHKEIYALSLNQVGVHSIDNGVKGRYEITNNDLRNIIAETGKDKYIRSIRGSLVPKIIEVLEKGEYAGWGLPDKGSHEEAACFVYYRIVFEQPVYLAMRYMKTEKVFKPYSFYSEENFRKYREERVKKEIPTI
ncbi:MAG: hypothetical protein J5769_03610 [Bacteroidales bacterium]|nr:hypothetical protein [Bacteroidales bacterium]